MSTVRPFQKQAGYSLIEVMVAMTIFAISSITIINSVLASRRVAEDNIYENTALTVAQGYMEQIKSIEYELLETIAANPSQPIPTMGIDASAIIGATSSSGIEVEDPLYLNVVNDKRIMIDLRNIDTENEQVIQMDFRVTPSVNDLNTGSDAIRALEFTLQYEYKRPGLDQTVWVGSTVSFVKSYAPTF